MDKFYMDLLRGLLVKGTLSPAHSILVLCGEQMDAEVFSALGCRDVTVTNLDGRHAGTWSTGARWERQDAENPAYDDGAFDWVVVHLGLHHCRQPHKALCEMYRIARRGVVVVEPCENPMVGAGRRLGIGQEYEVHAVAAHAVRYGGVNNSPIPNHVYRWTLGEVRRTIASYAPEYRPLISARSHLVVHWSDLRRKRNPARFALMLLLYPFLRLGSLVFPGIGNNLGICIEKPGDTRLQPWLIRAEGRLEPDRAWFSRHLQLGKQGQ